MRRLSLILLLFIGMVGCGENSSGCRWSLLGPNEGKIAPDFTLATLSDPAISITLSEFTRQGPVLLAFWATWCPPCVKEIPVLNQWAKSYKDQGLKILAVNVQESREDLLDFEKEHPFAYPVVLDIDGTVAQNYGVMGLPVAIYIAPGGKILFYGFGLPPNIDQLLAKN